LVGVDVRVSEGSTDFDNGKPIIKYETFILFFLLIKHFFWKIYHFPSCYCFIKSL